MRYIYIFRHHNKYNPCFSNYFTYEFGGNFNKNTKKYIFLKKLALNYFLRSMMVT